MPLPAACHVMGPACCCTPIRGRRRWNSWPRRFALPADVPDDAVRRPWAIRHVDVDVLGHGNNALAWAMVEEALADAGARLGRGTADAPVRVEVEFREAMPPAGHIELCWRRSDDADGPFDAWSLRTDEEGRSTTLMASRVSSVRPLPG